MYKLMPILKQMGACYAAREWVAAQGCATFQEAWEKCGNMNWMMWLVYMSRMPALNRYSRLLDGMTALHLKKFDKDYRCRAAFLELQKLRKPGAKYVRKQFWDLQDLQVSLPYDYAFSVFLYASIALKEGETDGEDRVPGSDVADVLMSVVGGTDAPNHLRRVFPAAVVERAVYEWAKEHDCLYSVSA